MGGRAAGIGPCFDLSTTHTYGSNHSRAVVRADFAWTDGRPVYRCVDGRQIHAESRVRVGRPGLDHVSTCRRRIHTEATIVGRWCGRTLHGRTVVNVSMGDRYMQKVGSGGRPEP